MVAGATTGTYVFGDMYASDMVLEVYERIGWRASALTVDMMRSAQRSFNFVQSRWSNLGVNLWEVELRQVLLEAGVAAYTLPKNTISMLPATFVRQLSLTSSEDLTTPFTTTLGSAVVTVTQSNSGLGIGDIVNVATPTAVGGIVLFGFYDVKSTPSATTYTIEAADEATSATTGGTLPVFTSDGSTSYVSVALTNQPFAVGDNFNVQVSVEVGGLTLSGLYPVVSISTNAFTIDVTSDTTVAESVTMNSSQVLVEYAPPNTLPQDRVLFPLSRDDYSSLAVKYQQGYPTSFWLNRQETPVVTIWPVPDNNGPYQLNYYALTQIQDASVSGGATIDIPYRFMEAYAAAVAAHLAMKWRPDIAPALMTYAKEVWQEASDADREVVSMYVSPDFGGYFRD